MTKKITISWTVLTILSLIVAGSTSATAYLLDPAVKKIFVDQDKTMAWLIPLAIIVAFSAKGISLYFARIQIINIVKVIGVRFQEMQNVLVVLVENINFVMVG